MSAARRWAAGYPLASAIARIAFSGLRVPGKFDAWCSRPVWYARRSATPGGRGPVRRRPGRAGPGGSPPGGRTGARSPGTSHATARSWSCAHRRGHHVAAVAELAQQRVHDRVDRLGGVAEARCWPAPATRRIARSCPRAPQTPRSSAARHWAGPGGRSHAPPRGPDSAGSSCGGCVPGALLLIIRPRSGSTPCSRIA
jgi:hypothetical protein